METKYGRGEFFDWGTFKNRGLHRHAEPTYFKALNGCNAGTRCSCRGTPSVPTNIQNKGFSDVPAPTHGSRSPLFLNWRIRSEKYIAAVVSTRNLPANQQNNANKEPTSRLKCAEICSTFRPRLVFLQLFIYSLSHLKDYETSPISIPFLRRWRCGRVTSEGNPVHLKVPGADVKAGGGVV